MHPYIHGTIPTYAILYFGAVIVCGVAAFVAARRMGLKHRVWIGTTLCYAFGMFVGAKLLYDVLHHELTLANLLTPAHYNGGLWGGPLVVLALAVPMALAMRDTPRVLDVVAMSLAAALPFAHVGCFLAGCCYGRPSSLPWAVTFPAGGQGPADVSVHPTQLYEVLALVSIFALLVALARRPRWQGSLLSVFLALYGGARALIEGFRGDIRVKFGSMSASQVICAGVCLAAVALVTAKLREGSQPRRE